MKQCSTQLFGSSSRDLFDFGNQKVTCLEEAGVDPLILPRFFIQRLFWVSWLGLPCTWLKHLGTVFLPLTIRSHEAADLIGASTHRAGRSF